MVVVSYHYHRVGLGLQLTVTMATDVVLFFSLNCYE